MAKKTISVEVQCRNCGSTIFEIPDEAANDPLAKCGQCGNVLGPLSSIYAKIRGEAHTPVNVNIITREIIE